MLFIKYKIKKKYIKILIYNKNNKGILFNEFFLKNSLNWIYIQKIIKEFLYECGLLKFKKN